jgi:hypothetical protein
VNVNGLNAGDRATYMLVEAELGHVTSERAHEGNVRAQDIRHRVESAADTRDSINELSFGKSDGGILLTHVSLLLIR